MYFEDFYDFFVIAPDSKQKCCKSSLLMVNKKNYLIDNHYIYGLCRKTKIHEVVRYTINKIKNNYQQLINFAEQRNSIVARLTSFLIVKFTPAAAVIIFTISVFPFSTAKCKGVQPSWTYVRMKKIMHQM